MLRDKMIDRWVEELDREIYDLLELREEVAGERLVIEDGADRRDTMSVPSDEIRIIGAPLEIENAEAIFILEALRARQYQQESINQCLERYHEKRAVMNNQ
ncbi:MAG: hypothetical protein K1W20_12920 [Lachnospiraceae bacterium]